MGTDTYIDLSLQHLFLMDAYPNDAVRVQSEFDRYLFNYNLTMNDYRQMIDEAATRWSTKMAEELVAA